MKRQISDKEKEELLHVHGRRCFIDGEPIPDDEPVEFHHIHPFSEGGSSTPDNIAPVCRRHHRAIRTMSLQEYRDFIQLGAVFEPGHPVYLDEIARQKARSCGRSITYEAQDRTMSLYFSDSRHDYPLYSCPTTSWRYFYATIPVEFIASDTDLQPRPLREASLWKLYRHFQRHTQLSPSICRMHENGQILLFDGQHKAAAQVWAGRSDIECKVYVEPDSRVLKETNLEAHGSLRQMTFYSHELMGKYADVFGADWLEYMDTEGKKSEQGFLQFLMHSKKKTLPQARREIELANYQQIMKDPCNTLAEYVEMKHRGSKQPLTFARLEKAILKRMLIPPPVEDEFESEGDFRVEERRNIVKLLTIIAEEGLAGKWAPQRNDAAHQKAERIFSAGAVRAWAIVLRDATNQHLRHYTDDERARFLYRRVDEAEFHYFRRFVTRLFSHRIWDDPDPAGEITSRLARDNLEMAKAFFEENGLTVGWVLRG